METKIHELQKQISESVEECHKMQQHWLRQQNELVKKTKEADEQSKTVDNLKKQLVIMEQKRLRIDGEYKCVCVCVCLCVCVYTAVKQTRGIHVCIGFIIKYIVT